MNTSKLPGFHYPYTEPQGSMEEKEFNVAPGIYVFAGGSTITLLAGETGYVLIDAGGGGDCARRVAGRIKELTDKPLSAIILTHGHPDHTSGGSVFLEGREDVPVWGLANFGAEGKGSVGLENISAKRAARQFGAFIPAGMRKRSPLFTEPGAPETPLKPIAPNRTFEGSLKLEIAGFELELYAAPGETSDTLIVWLPKEKVLLCADNIYNSFPNLYALRGSAYRDVATWAGSVDRMLAFNAHVLVPGHGNPEFGEAECRSRLANHRDAIMYVYSETVKGMNEGLSPEAIATSLALPRHLAELPYLGEFYGAVPFAVRGIYSGLLGWFDGNPSNLVIFTPREEAEHMAKLAGGAERLLEMARDALKAEDYRWVNKLADYYMNLGENARSESLKEMKRLKADALLALSHEVLPITGANYLMSCALELRKEAEC